MFCVCRRVIRFLVRHVKYFLGLRYEVSGWERLQTDGPYVIISNHQSSLDVLGEQYMHIQTHSITLSNTIPVKGVTICQSYNREKKISQRDCSKDRKQILADLLRIRPMGRHAQTRLKSSPSYLNTQTSHDWSHHLQAWWRFCRTAVPWLPRRSWYGRGRWEWSAGWEESSSSTAKRPATQRPSWATPRRPCWLTRCVFREHCMVWDVVCWATISLVSQYINRYKKDFCFSYIHDLTEFLYVLHFWKNCFELFCAPQVLVFSVNVNLVLNIKCGRNIEISTSLFVKCYWKWSCFYCQLSSSSRSACGCFPKARAIRRATFCLLKRERFIWLYKHRWA